MKYNNFTIIQALDVKQELERLEDRIRQDEVTLMAVDIENMYPSIRFSLIRKAVDYFSSKCSEEELGTIETCMDIVHFGMSNNYISFLDEFFVYKGAGGGNDVALAISGHESAFFADLVVSYVFEMLQLRGMFEEAIYRGIYRDDGLFVMKGLWSSEKTRSWLKSFQDEVDDIVGGDYLVFTASVWNPESIESEVEIDRVSVISDDYLPFLDVQMCWNAKGNLEFSVYQKPNQRLKYVGSDSTHTPATRRAIPNGVFQRLAKLMTETKELEKVPVNWKYPDHGGYLVDAGLRPTK